MNNTQPLDRMLTVALAGNPNSGKTTLFNQLTGAHQNVGNWPGVTVEKKEGFCTLHDKALKVVDLPGIYSLSPYSLEERLARNFLVEERPDVILNIVDGTNIERNLYLTLQLMELEIPMVVVINLMDDVRARGDFIDCDQLKELLHAPVVPISAKRRENLHLVMHELANQVGNPPDHPPWIHYDAVTREAIADIQAMLAGQSSDPLLNWKAIKLLEGDSLLLEELGDVREKVDGRANEYARVQGGNRGDRETLVADARYQWVNEISARSVKRKLQLGQSSLSDKIDRVLTHRFWALPLFILIMGSIFALTFSGPGAWLSGEMETLLTLLSDWVSGLLSATGIHPWVQSLVVDGALGGMSGVLTFLPSITILFLFLSLLEDSGYMARVAFIMDRPLRHLGLSGRSFIPMLMGFGCTTPAVMAARTMDNEDHRRMTILLTPFMSCGARLPVYALFAGAFFARGQALVVMSLYLLGIIMAIGVGLILKVTLFRKAQAPFLLEMPPYRWPSLRSTLGQVWQRVKGFLVKAGTIIFAMSVLIFLLQSVGTDFRPTADSANSLFAQIGRSVAVIFKPLGFGNWQSSVALLSGFVAKEAVVSTMAVLLGSGEGTQLTAMIQQFFTPLTAYAFLSFVLLYTPCVSAFVTIRREMNSMKWALLSVGIQMGSAYAVALLIYQTGRLFGWG